MRDAFKCADSLMESTLSQIFWGIARGNFEAKKLKSCSYHHDFTFEEN